MQLINFSNFWVVAVSNRIVESFLAFTSESVLTVYEQLVTVTVGKPRVNNNIGDVICSSRLVKRARRIEIAATTLRVRTVSAKTITTVAIHERRDAFEHHADAGLRVLRSRGRRTAWCRKRQNERPTRNRRRTVRRRARRRQQRAERIRNLARSAPVNRPSVRAREEGYRARAQTESSVRRKSTVTGHL